MLTIRLSRTGRSKYPTYRIVAAESARAATGKFVAVLGHYNPHTKELVIKKEEVKKHLSHGAQPSNTVAKLLQREKIELPKWVELKTKQSKPKSAPKDDQAGATEPKAEAKPEPEASDAETESEPQQAETPAAPEPEAATEN